MDQRLSVGLALVVLAVLAGGTAAPSAESLSPDAADSSDAPVDPPPLESAPTCPVETVGSATAADENETASPTTASDVRNDPAPAPRIVELYPNPTTDGNVGEYLVLETPPETTLENWTVTDGHTTAALPNETVSGRLALSLDPDVTADLTDDPVSVLEGHLRLAADGDALELRNGSTTVDTVTYDRAPQAERWYRTEADDRAVDPDSAPVRGDWHPRGATCLPVSNVDVDEATAFVLPDSPDVPRETIREADDRLLLAGYTITSDAIADDLVAAADRGVDVRVLLESGPVGGTPAATEDVLDALADGGVDVRAIGGEGSRYRYHHPKYAVADDAALITSENWKPSGVGGESSRGWGVVLEDERVANDLGDVFEADYAGPDTHSSESFRTNATFVDDSDGLETPPPSFSTEHESTTLPVDGVELLLAPDNAEPRLTDLLAAAEDELLVKQASVADDTAVLEETLEAARRGVDVRLLLDSSWYHDDENEALARDLERIADDESLSLAVRLVDDTDRFEKIHAKGAVIDGEVAVVGSANWNDNAFENNREVLVALYGTEIAAYYAAVFEADWTGDDDRWTLPFGLSATVVVALALAAVVGRRYVRFGGPTPAERDR